MKRTILLFLVLGLVGSAVILPLRYHFVVFQQKTHIVQKESMSWDHTYLNLDREPLKRRFILQSKTLRIYFMKHYANEALIWGKKSSLTLIERLKLKANKMLGRAVTKSKEWVKKEGPKHLEKIKKEAKKGLQIAKKKGQELIKNSQK